MSGNKSALSVVVAGGGTAGHIEPALAVADAVKAAQPDTRITALGTARGLETTLVPARGYTLGRGQVAGAEWKGRGGRPR